MLYIYIYIYTYIFILIIYYIYIYIYIYIFTTIYKPWCEKCQKGVAARLLHSRFARNIRANGNFQTCVGLPWYIFNLFMVRKLISKTKWETTSILERLPMRGPTPPPTTTPMSPARQHQPPRYAIFELLKMLKFSKTYFYVFGLFGQLRACSVSIAASGGKFAVSSSTF